MRKFKVLRKFDDNEFLKWVPEMDATIGEIGNENDAYGIPVIDKKNEVQTGTIHIYELIFPDGGSFWYPSEVLEEVNA